MSSKVRDFGLDGVQSCEGNKSRNPTGYNLVKVTRVATSDKIKGTLQRKFSPPHTSSGPQSLKRFVSGLFYLEGVG